MCFSGGGGDGGAAQARADEQARQDRINQGVGNINKNFAQFDDNFFNQRAKDYSNYATPQLNQQYHQTANNLAYGLARSGQSNSSEAARQSGEFQGENALARQQVADAATGQAQQARQDVENNRNSLLNQLNATSNPSLAAAGSMREAAALAMRPGFSPIGNLFQNTTATLNAANQGGYYGGPGLNAFGISRNYNTPGASNARNRVI
jgi:hypothetical protein